jgi:hypothetical protein
MDELVEVAARASGSLLLIDHGESVLVELLEELVPVDLVQRCVVAVFGIGEAETQNAGLAVLAGAGDLAGNRMARLGPSADLVVIPCCSGQSGCHRKAPSPGIAFSLLDGMCREVRLPRLEKVASVR